ncbi:putative ribonuclease H-like domain-containing protein [Tanacetum coccineum]
MLYVLCKKALYKNAEQKGEMKRDIHHSRLRKLGKRKADTKALITVDTLENWKEHESEDDEVLLPKSMEWLLVVVLLVKKVLLNDKSSEIKSNDYAFCVSSVKSSEPMTADSSLNAFTSSVSTHASEANLESSEGTTIQEPIIVQELPSFSCTDKGVKTSRTPCNKNGYFNKKASYFRKNNSSASKSCFVCGSYLHLIKDCNYYETQYANDFDGVGYPQREPIWDNATRVTQSNQFVPQAVLLRSVKVSIPASRPNQVPAGRPKPISTGRPKPVSTGKQNRPPPVHAGRRNSSSVTSGWWQSTARPMAHLPTPTSSYFQTSTPFGPHVYYNQMHYDGDGWATAVKPSAGCSWKSHRNKVYRVNLHTDAGDEGIVDSGCSRSMTGNKERLDDFQPFKGGKVTFGGGEGRITRKGTIRTPKLDFENVYYVKELQQFNLFSVSQICDKKNRVLFTDTDCLVLSNYFKLPDESMVLLRVPRKHNLYTFNLNNLASKENLACLVAKASSDEAVKWHRRMGHVNYKNMNNTRAMESVCDSVTPTSLLQHDSSTHGKDSVYESVTPRCMPHGMLTSPNDELVITYTQLSDVQEVDIEDRVIEDVIGQLLFEETKLDEETVVILQVPMFEEADVGRTEVSVFEEVDVGRTEEHVVEQVIVEEVVDGSFEEDVEHGNGEEAVEAYSDEQVDYDVEGIDVPFDNICASNLFPNDDLKGEDVDVVNPDGVDGDIDRNKIRDLGRSGKLKRIECIRGDRGRRSFVNLVCSVTYGSTLRTSSLLTDSSTRAMESVYDSVTPTSLPQHDSITHGKDSVYESVTPRCMPHDEEAVVMLQVIVEDVLDGSFEEDVEQGNGHEAVEANSDEQDVPFDNIGVTNLFPDGVLKGENVDVVNLDGFDGDTDRNKIHDLRRLRKLKRLKRGRSAADILKYAVYFAYAGENIINAARKYGVLSYKTGILGELVQSSFNSI